MRLSLRLFFLQFVLGCHIAWTATYTSAEESKFEDGVHYVTLEIPIAVKNKDTIEVTEYFSYGCPACYEFERFISVWLTSLADDVEFNRTPAIHMPGSRMCWTARNNNFILQPAISRRNDLTAFSRWLCH